MLLNFSSIITLLGVFQGFFLAFLLITMKSGNRRANLFLSIFLISACLPILFMLVFFQQALALKYPFTAINPKPLYYLTGPLLYYYIRFLIHPSFEFKKKSLVHFIPFLLGELFYLPQLFISRETVLGWISVFGHVSYNHVTQFIWYTFLVQFGAYLFLCMRLLKYHEKHIADIFSSTYHINLNWLKYILRVMTSMFTLMLVSSIYDIFRNIALEKNTTNNFLPPLVAAFICIIGYKGLLQPRIFSGQTEDLDTDIPDNNAIPADRIHAAMQKLFHIMNSKKPYLNPDLTLPMLAEISGISRTLLSASINESRNQNFYDYINTFRIEEVKKHLEMPENTGANILSIAYKAGFNSKSTFNSFFKKITNITPSAYQKKFIR